MKDLFEYYEKYGNSDYIGEDVSQIEHMTQAAMLAEENNESIDIILACFFHDIGHLVQEHHIKINGLGVKNHEKIGSQLLKDYNVPEPIPSLVENHVKTKRYKVYKFKDYYNKLSPSSKKTLEFQGGPMTKEEAKEFENDKLFEDSNKVREYDDRAKVRNVSIKPLYYYKELLKRKL